MFKAVDKAADQLKRDLAAKAVKVAGSVSDAAKLLGCSRKTLNVYLKQNIGRIPDGRTRASTRKKSLKKQGKSRR